MNKFLVVGLGNPGEQYDLTRHNTGFMFIDSLDVGPFKNFEKSMVATKEIYDVKVTFMKPLTYMNLSGEAVSRFVNYYGIPIENILIIFDDISLPIGKIRIRIKGSCGGHNGMRNIIDCLHTYSIKRIKVGIGNKPQNWDLDDWVISKFNYDEIIDLKKSLENCKNATELIIQNKIPKAMNLFN